MMKYMLDTNICIYTIKNRPEAVKRHFIKHIGEVCVSSIVVSELYYGAKKSGVEKHLKDVEGLLSRVSVLDFDFNASVEAGAVRAKLANKGTPIGPYDVLIAGHALSEGLTLVTNNTGEFSRVDGLMLENWVAD